MTARFMWDQITGQGRILAPRRADRPNRPSSSQCPFCPGAEHETPDEIDRIDGDDDGWIARVVPNLFPLTDHHEVVIMSPRHIERSRDMTRDEWAAAATLWQRRLVAHGSDAEGTTVAFINDGVNAGSSIPHLHSQVVRAPRTRHAASMSLQLVEHEFDVFNRLADSDALRIHADAGGLCLMAHPSPRFSGHLVIAPIGTHPTRFVDTDPVAVASAMQAALTAVGDTDLNVLVIADTHQTDAWYIDVLPRKGQMAGVELSFGIGVSMLDPADAAIQARERMSMARA